MYMILHCLWTYHWMKFELIKKFELTNVDVSMYLINVNIAWSLISNWATQPLVTQTWKRILSFEQFPFFFFFCASLSLSLLLFYLTDTSHRNTTQNVRRHTFFLAIRHLCKIKWYLFPTVTSTGRFSEAGLHEWMLFVIFCTRGHERLQRHFQADFWVGIASRCV